MIIWNSDVSLKKYMSHLQTIRSNTIASAKSNAYILMSKKQERLLSILSSLHSTTKIVMFTTTMTILTACNQPSSHSIAGIYENNLNFLEMIYAKKMSSIKTITPISTLDLRDDGSFVLSNCSPRSITGNWAWREEEVVLNYDSLSYFCSFPVYLSMSSGNSLVSKTYCQERKHLYKFKKVN